MCRLIVSVGILLGACTPATETRRLDFPKVWQHHIPPEKGKPRLHGVTTTFGGQIPIFVGASPIPRVLHLTSSESALWHIYLLPHARVRTIYVSGFEPQKIAIHRSGLGRFGKAPKVINLGTNLRSHETLSFGAPIAFEGAKKATYLKELNSVTGLSLTDFTGWDYVAPNQALLLSDTPLRRSRLRRHFPRAFQRNTRSPLGEWRSMQNDIDELIRRGILPSMLPLYDAHEAPEKLIYWPLRPDRSPAFAQPNNKLCGRYQLGTQGDDLLWCDEIEGKLGTKGSTLWLVAGGGRDVLIDTHLTSQVMSGGKGDDIINADVGNDIIYFGRDWGNDVVNARCFGPNIPAYWVGSPPEPAHQHSSYVVFGRGVHPSDLKWINANELVHNKSGSRIHFVEGACHHFRAVEPGLIPRPPLMD
jgi:hypothetical protein